MTKFPFLTVRSLSDIRVPTLNFEAPDRSNVDTRGPGAQRKALFAQNKSE